MGNPDERASESARLLSRARWGNQVVSRAASVVIERRDELDEQTRAEVVRSLTSEQEPAGE